MNYTYIVNTLVPKAEFMSVTYMADGYPDYRKNFNPTDFSEESLIKVVTDFAPNVVSFWTRQEAHPESAVFTGESGSAEAPVVEDYDITHVPTIEPEPEYDHFTQYVTLNDIEDPKQATRGWTIHEMTAEEQADFLSQWRASFFVSMRQARLALTQEGYMTQVEDKINSLSEPDKTKLQTEWEYASKVERNSDWIGTMQPALGLSDEQMDNLFKLASTL